MYSSGAFDDIAAADGFPPPPPAPPRPQPPGRAGMSLKEALVEVMQQAERPLTSSEIVARVMAMRPGSPDPSIRSEISRARKLGVIRLQGDPRGGTYTFAPRIPTRPAPRAT